MSVLLNSIPEQPGKTKRALLAERLRKAADSRVPLSFAQQRLWFLDQLEPNSPLYNVPTVAQLSGTLNLEALQRALDGLASRHESLRTRFVDIEGSPAQVVDKTLRLNLDFQDLSGRPADERDAEAQALVRAEVSRPFNLSSGPPIRATLIRVKPDEHWFVLNIHHIVSDEWSLKICFQELTELYAAHCEGRAPKLPELPIQYADYSAWQREWLKDDVLEEQLSFWRDQLQGAPPMLELPPDHPRVAMQTFRGTIQSRVLRRELSESLTQLGARHGATLFMVTLAAFKALLHRYTQQTDVVIGSPIAGRNRMETEQLVGFFVNTLLLRTDISGDPTFEELLGRVRETTLNAYAHEDLPFEKLVERLHPERAATHTPFTSVLFALQNSTLEKLEWPNLILRFVDFETGTAKFDLTMMLQVTGRGLVAQAEYNSDLFEAGTIARLLEHFEILLEGIAQDPSRRLSELPLLGEAERRQVVDGWNDTKTEYPRQKCIHELFEEQVARAPNAVAVVYGNQSVTYEQLNQRANRLAHYLQKYSVGPDVLVGVCLERSVEMIVGMLAILKAGGAYVPIEARYPRERLAFMLADAGTPVLLTQQRLLSRLPKPANPLCLDSDWELIARESQQNLGLPLAPENLAYVIYTSGSTGTPKGVAVPHRAVNRLVLNTNYIQFSPNDRVAQVSTASFDAATFEIWGALLNGATLVGITRDVTLSPRDFARELRDQNISAMFLTAALFNQLASEVPDAFATVRTMMFGGEAGDPKSIARVLKHTPPQHLVNGYGPTENTTFSACYEVKSMADDATTVPIGRPISNSQCYILDARLNPMPIGVPGELHVGGDGLARGYWNRPQLTEQKFIPNPFQPGALIYKTGDLARWLPDGNIEFLGRLDEQVKIRGFRVELGEIESILARHPAIRECAVTMRKDENGCARLLAYFICSGKRVPPFDELLRFLKERLPDHMVPAAFVPLDALPLTPNGKVDRNALPDPGKNRPLVEGLATPRDAVELKLTEIWQNVLDVYPIGIEDKFFDLGGHSLLAVKLIAQIEKVFGRRLRVATVFQAPTIEQLAAVIREEIQEGSALAGTSLVEIQSQGTRPPLFLVHGAGGGMFWGYVNLSRHLGTDQPVYGLKSRGLDGREELGSIEEMAAQYVADIRALQPHGPYHLGGYCFGGNVALEMARQFQAQGEEVALLALLNCSPPNSEYERISWTPAWFARFGRNLLYWANYFRHWTPAQRREFFRWKKEIVHHRITGLFRRGTGAPLKVDAGNLVDLSSFPADQRKLWRTHIGALLDYHPQPYAGRVHLFRSPGHPMLCSFAADYGWGVLAKGVDISIVPGVHEKILEEPCVRAVAKGLKASLDELSTAAQARNPGRAAPAPAPEPQRPANVGAVAAGESMEFPLDKTYATHFENQAARTPNAVAVRFQKQELTYAELNARANHLAHHLKSLGVGPETLVAVCLDRSLELIVALLAIWKAGGAYLALDRSYPNERLSYMLSDSHARLLLTRTDAVSNLKPEGVTVVCLDDSAQAEKIQVAPADNPVPSAAPDNLAYVIYTSGSTGKPKGVQITQRSLLNHNFAVARAYELRAEDRVLQFSPVSFDISVEEIFPSLLRGCTLVLRDDDVLSSTARFMEFTARERLTVLNLPTAYWHELVDYLQTALMPPSVRLVVIGGEKASDEAWRRWKFRIGEAVKLINTYGPTETTVIATLHAARLDDETLPIGRPLPNVETMILDAQLKPVGMGETGELYIGGFGVARGYLNRPELTAERFVSFPSPAGQTHRSAERRFYKTGDLARMRADGVIEFVGRLDEQVKIRGFRIELGEIETALCSHPGLKEAVVAAREDVSGRKKLVAYFVPGANSAPSVGDLLALLKTKLPPYMVPSAFVQLPALPMTPAGKVDRRALPEPGRARPNLGRQFVAPRTPMEEVIAHIWGQVLGLDGIGVDDNFFDLGGHSLLATQVISQIRESLQMETPLASLFTFPTVAALAEHLADVSFENQPVLPVAVLTKGEQLPLTQAQWRTWFLDQFEPGQSNYNIPTLLRLKGPLNFRALEQSFTALYRRHEALRAIFPTEDGKSVQIICEPREVQLPVRDFSDLPESEREASALAEAEREAAKPYVMSRPVLRPRLMRLGENEHLLLIVTHAVACDAVSTRILVQELVALYGGFASGQLIKLPPLRRRYATALESLQLPPEIEREQIQYWTQRLKDAPALLDLPADRPRPAHQSDAGARHRFTLPPELANAIEHLSGQEDCTPFMVLLAAFQTLLSRYTNATDLVVGTKVSIRHRAGLEEMVGKFDNLLALRCDANGDPEFREFLRRVRESTRGALAHDALLFERILNELAPERNASYSPIFQVMFDYDNQPLVEVEAAGLRFSAGEIHNHTSKLDLRLHLAKTASGLAGRIEYSTALFDADRIERMAGHFAILLNAILRNPSQRLSELPLMPESELQKVLVEWNATKCDYPRDATLAQLFESQVRRSPGMIALVDGSERLSYAELNARANQVALRLRQLGVGPGRLVGICMKRSWRMLVGILGVLKAGGAYVPLDPAYPKDRLAFILEDTRAPVLLTEQALRGLPTPDGTLAICLDSDWPKIQAQSRNNVSSDARSSDLAYVIYTSGSTGKPKGVAIEHANAVALVYWARDVFAREELGGVLAATSICFDLSVFEMFVPLSWGGTVILAENALALPGLPARAEVTLVNTVPSAIRELLRIKGVPPNVRVVNLAGEPLITPLVNQIYGETSVQKVYDLYGPSETTTYSTFTLRKAGEPATIGRPLANEQVYLLDKYLRPVPIGIPGEIYIGGDGVAREYLNRPELTAEKFIPVPPPVGQTCRSATGRLYKTGDLARWRADGNLEFLGRIDHQVKIRGFRIELGEIEAVLRKHPALRESVVLVREDRPGDKRLAAYVVRKPEARVDADELRRFAREALPEYMVPPAFVFLDALPLTPNGKVDRKALPAPDQERRDAADADFVEAGSQVEEQLAAIWREVLGIERISVRDNFFELGGHSLLAIQVISRVREKLKVELPLFSLFDSPTIQQLARGLDSGEWTQHQLPLLPMQPVPRDGRLPLSSVQERLWFLDQVSPGSHAYNVPVALRLQGVLDTFALQRALGEVIRRHEALRTTFTNENGELLQVIAPSASAEIEVTNLEPFPANERENNAKSWLNQEARRPFDLARGPLIRVKLARLNATDHALCVVMHHAISDGWSLSIFFQELETFYRAFAAGKPAPEIPALPVQYADFAHWQRQWMQGAKLEQERAYWKNKLSGAPASVNLPVDRVEPASGASGGAGRVVKKFSATTAEALGAFSHRENATPFMVLMTALAITFERWARQQDMVLGTVVAGRTRREVENVIGCFMNFLPIRAQINPDDTGHKLLARVRSTVLEAQGHQDCPFEKIVEAVNPERRLNQNPLYNVALLLQNFPEQLFADKSLEVTPMPVDVQAAQLDLRFEAEFSGQNLSLVCEYKTDLFNPGTIEQMLASYREVLETLLKNPGAKLEEFAITPALKAHAQPAQPARAEEADRKIAIAATFTAEPLEEPLRYWMNELELPAEIEFAPFNQVFQQLLDPAGVLATNARGANVVLARLGDFGGESDAVDKVESGVREFLSTVKSATARMTTPLLIVLCPDKPKQGRALESIARTAIAELEKLGGVYVVTADELLDTYPVADFYDGGGDDLGCVPYTPVFFTALATMIARKFHALQRAPHKVIVLDCDQTLWSGVCGEDGARGICLDAPRKALQDFMRAQAAAGRLLAVCSKNSEEDVREVFAQRLDMPLRHEHFAAWRVNWSPKSENIKSIAKELNLGLDSFIFVDDNPVECAEVEANCPGVLTLQLPEDPAEIPQFLKHCWAFDVLKVTAEDTRRAQMYREGRQREELRAQAGSLTDFIAGLNLKIQIAPMAPEQLARVSQLTLRTNQFNLTTLRRTEPEIQSLTIGGASVLTVCVADRFGDYGLVGVMIGEERAESLDVDTFLLSCRVLGRGVEHAMLAHLGGLALKQNKRWVNLHFHPSAKNKPALDFLQSVGAEFKQPLNGGFVYVFPTQVAAEMKFEAKNAGEAENVGATEEKNSSLPAPAAPSVRLSRCRSIALELNDPARIHEAIEGTAEVRAIEQDDYVYVAPRTKVEKQICELWEKLLHIERVGVTDNFFELGGHSLLAVRLFAELEKLTGRKLPLVTLFQAPTVEELARLADGNQTGSARSVLVPVQAKGSRPPLFLVHGAGGDVLWGYANLAKHMSPDQPIYGIKSRGQIGLDEYDHIEDMARYYLQEVRALQPHGPYFLGGYCFGGNVAYEMARQLHSQGERVAQLLLIDASPSNAGYERLLWWRPAFHYRFARNAYYWLKDFVTLLEPQEQRRYIVRKARVLWRKLAAKCRRENNAGNVDLDEVIDVNHFPDSELKFWQIHLNALVAHVERPYKGSVTLLRTRGQPMLCSFEEDFCWGKLARGGVIVKHIPGSHENIFVEPNVKFLAEQMEECLTEGAPSASPTQKILSHELV
ncbi:MAG TPA: amino acid adenylation domain-containing protein [Verrucomicrobiae bacterium]|jgi:amino acid adenylation domain-containing protein/FkbH-like protein|nr:amino acid adenylation domain-containing protein [Verrucomicrobiae bacterium]